MVFGQRPYVGRAVSWKAFPEFGHRIQHVVLFEDGTKGDYLWGQILKGAEAFVTTCAATGALLERLYCKGEVLRLLRRHHLWQRQQWALCLWECPPLSQTTPFRPILATTGLRGRVVDREVLASGDHRWRVQLLAPRHDEVTWMDRAEFLKQLEMHNLKLRLNHSARKLPTVAPVRGLR